MGILRSGVERWEAFVNTPNRRALVVALGIALMLAVVSFFAEELMERVLWNPLAFGLNVLRAEPMGTGGLLVIGSLILCMIFSFVDTSPNAAVLKVWLANRRNGTMQVTTPLTEDDKHAIARIRTLWNDEGGGIALEAMYELLNVCASQYEKLHYGRYYKDLAADLGAKGMALGDALSFEHPKSVKAVVTALEVAFRAYLACAEVIYNGHQQQAIHLEARPFNESFHRIRDRHAAFRQGITGANNFQGLDRHLAMFAPPGMPLASRKFLGEQPWDGVFPERLPPAPWNAEPEIVPPVSSVDV